MKEWEGHQAMRPPGKAVDDVAIKDRIVVRNVFHFGDIEDDGDRLVRIRDEKR